jgi:hypothetical protein
VSAQTGVASAMTTGANGSARPGGGDSPESHEVMVIGGGGCGLSVAALLSNAGFLNDFNGAIWAHSWEARRVARAITQDMHDPSAVAA